MMEQRQMRRQIVQCRGKVCAPQRIERGKRFCIEPQREDQHGGVVSRHCEEQSDEATQNGLEDWIASLRSQ